MNKSLAIILFILATTVLQAQHRYQELLEAIDANNPTLKAMRAQTEADRMAVGVGQIIEDPEVELGYFKGSPAEVGQRWDFSVTQQLELPSVYIHKRRLYEIQRQSATLQYEVVRAQLFYEAQLLCAEWIYCSAVQRLYGERVATATEVAELYQKRFAEGDCNVIDCNRAQLYLVELQTKLADAELHTHELLLTLQMLTNSEHLVLNGEGYPSWQLADSFEAWYEIAEQRNSTLRYLTNQVDEKQQEVSLNATQWLPKLHVGYASESVAGEAFSGVVAGMSLPLWNNRNSVRQARQEVVAANEALTAHQIETRHRLKGVYQRAKATEGSLNRMVQAYSTYNSAAVLRKALDAGELPLEHYLQELDSYAERELNVWQKRHELERLVLQLNAVAL